MRTRRLNGYVVDTTDKDPKTCKYVHRQIVEKELGRPLVSGETVHHLDGKRDNNDPVNLLVLNKNQHAKLERWIQAGMPHSKDEQEYHNAVRQQSEITSCLNCGTPLTGYDQSKYCSHECHHASQRAVLPPIDVLKEKVATSSYEAVGREFGVTGGCIKKRIKKEEQ